MAVVLYIITEITVVALGVNVWQVMLRTKQWGMRSTDLKALKLNDTLTGT